LRVVKVPQGEGDEEGEGEDQGEGEGLTPIQPTVALRVTA
jgi:hypothetical protein